MMFKGMTPGKDSWVSLQFLRGLYKSFLASFTKKQPSSALGGLFKDSFQSLSLTVRDIVFDRFYHFAQLCGMAVAAAEKQA